MWDIFKIIPCEIENDLFIINIFNIYFELIVVQRNHNPYSFIAFCIKRMDYIVLEAFRFYQYHIQN